MKQLFFSATSIFMLAFMTPVLATDVPPQDHPGIRHAIATLEQTREELQNGEHGFGGHSSKAVEHIDAALRELHEALAFANEHPESIKPPEKQ